MTPVRRAEQFGRLVIRAIVCNMNLEMKRNLLLENRRDAVEHPGVVSDRNHNGDVHRRATWEESLNLTRPSSPPGRAFTPPFPRLPLDTFRQNVLAPRDSE